MSTNPQTPGNAIATYGVTDLNEIRNAREQMATEAANRKANYLKLQVGATILRILPPWSPAQRMPFYEAWVHYLRNPAEPDSAGKPVLCPLKMRKASSCVACAMVSRLYKNNNKADEKAAKDMRSGRRLYANVVDMKNVDKGVQVMEFGSKLYEDFLALMSGSSPDDPTALGDISHPDTGYLMVIDRVGTGQMDTRYSLRAARAPSPIAKREWLLALNDLSKLVGERDPEEMTAIMEGRAPQDTAPVQPVARLPGAVIPGSPEDSLDAALFT